MAGGARRWIRDHDESWVFVAGYIGLAVGLSVFVSLFWLVAVAALHLALELVRQTHYHGASRSAALHALWEIKLDIGLVLVALSLVLYIDVILGILGLQSAARAAAVSRTGARIGSRAAAWERNLRAFLLTVDDMARITYAAVMLRRRKSSDAVESVAAGQPDAATTQEKLRGVVHGGGGAGNFGQEAGKGSPVPVWRRRWGVADRIGVGLIAVGTILVVAAPLVTPHDWGSAAEVLMIELHPYGS